MKTNPNKRFLTSKGLTLVELLVAGAVSSFLLISILSLVTSFLRTRAVTQYSYSLQSISENVFNHLTVEIQDSDSIDINNPSELTLTQGEDQITYYLSDQGSLMRSGPDQTAAITPQTIKVLSFQVFDVSDSSSATASAGLIPSLIDINLELQNFTKGVPRDSLTSHTTISTRPHKGFLEEDATQ